LEIIGLFIERSLTEFVQPKCLCCIFCYFFSLLFQPADSAFGYRAFSKALMLYLASTVQLHTCSRRLNFSGFCRKVRNRLASADR